MKFELRPIEYPLYFCTALFGGLAAGGVMILFEGFDEIARFVMPVMLIAIGSMAFIFSIIHSSKLEILRKVRELTGAKEKDETQPRSFSLKVTLVSLINVSVMAIAAFLTKHLYFAGKLYYFILILPIILVLWIVALILPVGKNT